MPSLGDCDLRPEHPSYAQAYPRKFDAKYAAPFDRNRTCTGLQRQPNNECGWKHGNRQKHRKKGMTAKSAK